MPEHGRRFSPQFKAEAVQMVIETCKPVADVARDLGIHDGILGNWVNAWRHANPTCSRFGGGQPIRVPARHDHNPDGRWTTQQIRNVVMDLDEAWTQSSATESTTHSLHDKPADRRTWSNVAPRQDSNLRSAQLPSARIVTGPTTPGAVGIMPER